MLVVTLYANGLTRNSYSVGCIRKLSGRRRRVVSILFEPVCPAGSDETGGMTTLQSVPPVSAGTAKTR